MTGASRSSKHSRCTRSAISAPKPAMRQPSSTITQRLVLRTEARIVSRSSGRSVRGSITSASTPADAKGLLKAALRDDNPVIFIEHEYLYGQRGEVPDGDDHIVNFGEAVVRREGSDVTIVGISRMASTTEKAARILSEEHEIEAEVIDPRTLRPLDLDTILASVRKTNRCVIVEEGWPHGGVGANLAALVQEQAFDDLDAPVGRVTGADVPMPYAKNLEQIAYPHEPQVVQAVLATFRDL